MNFHYYLDKKENKKNEYGLKPVPVREQVFLFLLVAKCDILIIIKVNISV